MGETVCLELSDGIIRDIARDDFVDIVRDANFPDLRLRYLTDRRRGTWETRHAGKWARCSGWPAVNCETMISALPEVLRGRADNVNYAGLLLVTVGDLLDWWLDRQLNARKLSKVRKYNCRSTVAKWLRPALFQVRIMELSKAVVDQRFIQHMQAKCAPATVCRAYRMLVAAIHAAQAVGLLAADPLAKVKFSDFGLGKIKPRDARLIPKDSPIAAQLLAGFDANPRGCMLALLMLLFGLRVGETRQLRWADFDLPARLLVLPAELTKTRSRHELPLTDEALLLLSRYRDAQPWKASVYLFPGESGQPLSAQAAQVVIRSLSGGAWSSHDLRKMARASWAELGVDYLVAELLLNHALPGLAATYVQTNLQQLKREALELWHGAGNDRARGLALPA